MGLEGDTVVQELVDIILMEDRSASSKTVCSLLCLNGDGDDVVCWFTSLKTQDGTIQMHQEYNTRASS